MREILRIKPDTDQVVLTAGSDGIEHEYVEYQEGQFRPYVSRARFRYLADLSLMEILDIVRQLPAKTVIVQSAFSWDSRATP
jgi:hypothetical protein